MFYELFLISLGAAILTVKEARELMIGAIVVAFNILMWVNKLIFGEPRATPSKQQKSAKKLDDKRAGKDEKMEDSKKEKAPAIVRRRKAGKEASNKDSTKKNSAPPQAPALPRRKHRSPSRESTKAKPKIIRRRNRSESSESTKTEAAPPAVPTLPPWKPPLPAWKNRGTSAHPPNPISTTVDSKEEEKQKEDRARAERRKAKRENAEIEMVACEESYIDSLTILRDVYQMPMERNRKSLGLEEKDLNTIFSSYIPSIIQLHRMLLADFKSKGRRKCGEVLYKNAPFFKMYTAYLNGYDAALDLISANRKGNRKFAKFLSKQRKGDLKAAHKWKYMDIASYLIMPVQRIPRYELLLKEIIKNTPEGDQELPCLKNALEMVRDAAQHNNQSMRSYQDVQKIVEIQGILHGKLKDEIIQPHRCLVGTFAGTVSTLSEEDAEKISTLNWDTGEEAKKMHAFRRRMRRPSLTKFPSANKGKDESSNNSAVLDFRTAMEEKLHRLKNCSMREEPCDIFVFSDVLVWVARREDLNQRQGHLELDETISAKDLENTTTDKPLTSCLICSPVVNLRISFIKTKKLEEFRHAFKTSLAECCSPSSP